MEIFNYKDIKAIRFFHHFVVRYDKFFHIDNFHFSKDENSIILRIWKISVILHK